MPPQITAAREARKVLAFIASTPLAFPPAFSASDRAHLAAYDSQLANLVVQLVATLPRKREVRGGAVLPYFQRASLWVLAPLVCLNLLSAFFGLVCFGLLACSRPFAFTFPRGLATARPGPGRPRGPL